MRRPPFDRRSSSKATATEIMLRSTSDRPMGSAQILILAHSKAVRPSQMTNIAIRATHTRFAMAKAITARVGIDRVSGCASDPGSIRTATSAPHSEHGVASRI